MDAMVDLMDDEDELFFEGPDVEAEAPPPAPPEPQPQPKRKVKAAPAPAEPDPAPLPLPLPVLDLAPLPVTAPEPAPAAEPLPAAATPAIPRLVLIALALAAVASLFSAIGLLVAVRTVHAAGLAREEAEHGAASLQRLDHAIGQVEGLAKAQKALVSRGGAQLLTTGDLHRELDALRQSYARTQAPGTQALAGVVRQGQSELSNRIDDLESRIDAISQRATLAARH